MTDGGRRSVYMDHVATIPVRQEVAGAMLPSSLYALAREAKGSVEEAREKGG
ncbi:hypothetical protein [Methanoculleus formosensis]|uniref:hypothetical protein n=1 Tax=Methanoculleus formosensis TaxID=2590886 RepID=UPI0021C09AB5|nr:hypothetical protein [Methanoculleus sp. Afa-1]